MQADRPGSGDQLGDGAQTPNLPTILHAVAAEDGTLAVQYVHPITGEAVRLTFTADGDYSLLRLREDVWREVGINFAAGPRSRGPALMIRSAASRPDGTVTATLSSTALRGQQVRRSLLLESDGRWSSDYDQTQPDGPRITGTATTTRNADGRVTRQRQMLNASGEQLWMAEDVTEPVVGRMNQPRIGWAGSAAPMLRTIGSTTYADGGVGSTNGYMMLTSTGASTTHPSRPTGITSLTVSDSGPGWTRTTSSTTNWDAGTEDAVSVTKFDDGRVSEVTRHDKFTVENIGGVPIAVPKSHDTTIETRYPDGAKDFTREKSSTTWDEDRPDIDPGGEASGASGKQMHTDSWSKVTVGRDGSVTRERGAETHSAAGQSRSTSETGPDGKTVITTTTTDNDGNGTRHTTVLKKDGSVESDKTERVGSGGGSSSTGGDNSNEDDSDDPPPDNGGDDGAPLGDELGPSGSGQHGDDEPMSILPGHSARAYGAAIIIDDPLHDPDHDEARSIPAQMAAGLTYDALVNPGVAYGDQGDEVGSSGAGYFGERPTSQATMILDTVPVPPEEEFQWENPEVHYAFVAATIAALRRGGGLDAKRLDMIESNLADVTAFAHRLSATNRVARHT